MIFHQEPAVAGQAQGAGLTPQAPASRREDLGHHTATAFTLLEVMVAGGILFISLFAILGLVSNSLRSARALQHQRLDAGMAAAQMSVLLAATNQVPETGSGDFGDAYPDYSYEYHREEVGTNGLCQVDIVVHRRSGDESEQSQLSLLLYLPNLQRSGMGGGFRR